MEWSDYLQLSLKSKKERKKRKDNLVLIKSTLKYIHTHLVGHVVSIIKDTT